VDVQRACEMGDVGNTSIGPKAHFDNKRIVDPCTVVGNSSCVGLTLAEVDVLLECPVNSGG